MFDFARGADHWSRSRQVLMQDKVCNRRGTSLCTVPFDLGAGQAGRAAQAQAAARAAEAADAGDGASRGRPASAFVMT